MQNFNNHAQTLLSLLCDSIEKKLITITSIVWDYTKDNHSNPPVTFSLTYSHNEDNKCANAGKNGASTVA